MISYPFVSSLGDLRKRHERERELLRQNVIVEAGAWKLAKAIARSGYTGESELLRGVFLPERKKGRILWWPARLGSHFTGIIALGVDRDEERLELEINLTEEGYLSYFPFSPEDYLAEKFLSEPTIRGHDDGYLSIRGRRIRMQGKAISLERHQLEGAPA